MTVSIRKAITSDGHALYAAWEALRHHYAVVDRRIVPTPVSQEEFVADFGEMLARETSVAFVAELDGEIMGFLSGGIEANQPGRLPDRHASIGYLYVEPSARRLGVGTRLYEALVEWAAGHDDVAHTEMVVPASDLEASAFWHQLGFRPFLQRLWAPLTAGGGDE